MSNHDFQCISVGMYDDTMQCQKCEKKVVFSADGPEKQRYWEAQECPVAINKVKEE